MLCQECQKKPATVHLTQIVDDEQSVQHLCEQCAQEKGDFHFDGHPPFSIHNLLTGLMNMDAQPSGQVIGYSTKVQCENCGLTYAQFGQIGRFGCSRCYPTFGERLLPLMRRIHGSTQHVGKVPTKAGGVVKLRRSIEEMRAELQALVAREEFEKAAEVRDQIRRMETEIEGGGEPNA
ncbi:UvrB/UvrC motif-containing protein [Dethiobacter alkaliphilus]|uniref:UvrB/UvrC protein n=1 Tax=Dethiobacter alkaliphilus AHT 1 TaxID=555088 RepID=C0GF52_DETAL|nr:UvrB/UvrC motif-containing protein [Dethiobacter alkaliphilus]EEG78234.1 UvrB/UvrC protein [Dethiobacter alkaliphilus AHT 1]